MEGRVGGRFKKWRRRALKALLLGASLGGLAVAGAWAALQFPGTRAAILDAINTRLEAHAGLRATASDFTIAFATGKIEVHDVRLAAADPGAPPFLTVSRARARLHWKSLFAGRPVFDHGEVVGPLFDFDAPLPRGTGRSRGEGPIDAGVEVLDVHVRDGAVRADDVPPALRAWADAARAEGVEARASLRGGTVVVESASGTLRLESAARPTIVAGVSGAATIGLDGRVAIDSLEVHADGLAARGSGRTEDSTYETALAVDLDAGKLFPDLTPKGELHAEGTLRVVTHADGPPTWRGNVVASAGGFPAILLQPWLEPALGSSFDPSGTHLEGEANLEFDVRGGASLASLELDSLAGRIEATWRREETVLAHAALDVSDGDAAPDALHVRFEAQVIPSRPGRRLASGELDLRAGAPLRETRFRGVRLRIDEPEPAITAERLGFHPDVLRDTLPEGIWHAVLDLDGTTAALVARAAAEWELDAETVAAFHAVTSPASRSGTDANVELTLLPNRPGRRSMSAELFLPPANLTHGTLVRRGMAWIELQDAGAEVERLSRLVALVLPRPAAAVALERLRQFRASGITGPFTVEAVAAGRLDALEMHVRATWSPVDDERLHVDAEGLFSALDPLGESWLSAEIELSGLRLSRILRAVDAFSSSDPDAGSPSEVEARIDATLQVALEQGRFAADIEAESVEVEVPGPLHLRDVRFVARTDGRTIDWTTIESGVEVFLKPASDEPVRARVRGSGRTAAGWPPGPAALELSGESSLRGLESWSAHVALDGGTLRVDPLRVSDSGEPATLSAEIPLGSLGSLSPAIAAAGFLTDTGPLSMSFDRFEVAPWVELIDPERALPPLAARVTGDLSVDLLRPAEATGTVAVNDVSLTSAEGLIELAQGPQFRLVDGRVLLPRTRVRAKAPWFSAPTEADVSLVVELSREWRPGDSWMALVRDIDLEWNGLAPTSLLELWMPGRGLGMLDVDLSVKGPLDAPVLRISASGPTAEFRLAGTLPTKLSAPEARAEAAAGVMRIESSRVRINGGTCDVTGTIERENGLRLNATCAGVRYRLQYGVTISLGGRLALRWPWTGRRRLEGDVVVERAVLRRDVDLDLELLRAVLEPEFATDSGSVSEAIEIDLSVTTDEGLQIKNNLADLHVQWGRVAIGGTLDAPVLSGRVDIDPGGRLVLPGQTLRVDEGSLVWSGEAPSEPRIQLETTSSLVDPTIQQTWRSDWADMGQLGPGRGGSLDFASRQQAETTEFVSAFSTGVLTHYQSRLAGSVTRGIGATQISYEPLPLFGETNSQARFTVSQDMTKYLTFIASSDPRQAEAQTYIADVHALPMAPSIRSQLFTNDEKNAGITVQQKLQLGSGSGAASDVGPRLGSIVIAAPEEVPTRKIRRAIEHRKGDPFAEGATLDVEVDAAEALRRRGFPAADVRARSVPVAEQRVDVHVLVEPGPQVRFEFVGEKLGRPARHAVIANYRPEIDNDPESFEAMFRSTVRALRALGFVEPEVAIEALPPPTDASGPRTVRVRTVGGRKIEPGPPLFEGVSPDVGVVLSSLFEGQFGRVELAAAAEEADAFLLQSLEVLGHPSPRIVSRTLSDDGTDLRVVIDPGPREVVAQIEIEGIDPEDAASMREVVEIVPGDPARRDRITRGAAAIEARLRERGHADASVQFSLAPHGDRPAERLLRYRAEPGPAYRIDGVHFEGLRSSKPKWVAKVAGLDIDEPLRQDDIAEARGRLYRTGVFRRIRVELDPPIGPDGSADSNGVPGEPASPSDPGSPIHSSATFRLEEAPRYQLSYGGRWESSRGIGVVLDLTDRNSFGRGQISGVRGILSQDQQSLRLFHAFPRVFRTRNRLELFLEGRREIQDLSVLERTLDAWVQMTIPVTRRTQTRTYLRMTETRLSRIDDGDPNAPELDERTASPQLGWQFVYDTSTRPIGETRRGVFAGLDLNAAHEALGSDLTSVGLFDQLKFFVPLSGGKNPGFSWAQSWRTSFVTAQDEPVPFADRLRLGGEYSVRGYPTDSLGPQGPDGLPLGGEFLFVVNQELHGRIYGSLTGLAFFDAGNVWENPEDVDTTLFHSWGLGLRYVSPVGPLRLDVGLPLDRREADPDYTVYFGFGNVF